MERPVRQPNRLKEWDYSHPGAYFVTICTKGRECLFWRDVGANCVRPLSKTGCIVQREIARWNETYEQVQIDKYVVMPNHIHVLLRIVPDANGRTQFAPTLSRMVKQFKGAVTKQIGMPLFQRSFHDHIIRDERDYQMIWQYIDQNPLKWELDCFYTP
ncbi:MAG: transposase [Clostridia bacterium]|nr:transposase [Clostridia bacterium]